MKHDKGSIHVHRVPFFAARWSWTVDLGDFWSVSGWAMTKRGAIREAQVAAIGRNVEPRS